MSKHDKDNHKGMDVHMASQEGDEKHGGMDVCMSGNHGESHEKEERGHGEKVKMNG